MNSGAQPQPPARRKTRSRSATQKAAGGAAERQSAKVETPTNDSPTIQEATAAPRKRTEAPAAARKKKQRTRPPHANGNGQAAGAIVEPPSDTTASVQAIQEATAHLATLPAEHYELGRKSEAARLRIRVTELDVLVKTAREERAIAELASRPERECTPGDYARAAKRCGQANGRAFERKVRQARFDRQAREAREKAAAASAQAASGTDDNAASAAASGATEENGDAAAPLANGFDFLDTLAMERDAINRRPRAANGVIS
jgi:hypothetical protein